MHFFKDIDFPYSGKVEDGHKRCHTPLYYGIQFNEAGTLRLRIGDGKLRTFQGPCAFITHPGTEFFYEIPSGEKHNYFVICFTGSGVRQFIKSKLLDLSPRVYKIGEPEKFKSTMQNLVRKHNTLEHDYCVLELQNLMLQLRDTVNLKKNVPHIHSVQYRRISELAEAIKLAPEKNWDFTAEARKLNMSPRYFRMIFTKVTQLSPHNLMLKERLHRAAHALTSGNETIYNIAAENGFQDPFYFSRIFKKYYRLSPLQYRKEFSADISGHNISH